MARIAGVNLPTNKRVVIALRYIYGIGPAKAQEICADEEPPLFDHGAGHVVACHFAGDAAVPLGTRSADS